MTSHLHKGTATPNPPNTPTPDTPPGPYQRLVRDLTAELHERKLGHALRWRYGTVSPDIIRATRAATSPEECEAFSTVAVAFALWHFAHQGTVHHGKTETSLGRSMRQLGTAGAYGPKDFAADRSLRGLVSANTYPDLHATVVNAATRLKSVDHPPHWATLAAHLVTWQHNRDTIRALWARDFYKYTPTTTDEGNN